MKNLMKKMIKKQKDDEVIKKNKMIKKKMK